ncbi:unnamed protein product, partial [Bubo scandiacus]
MWRSGMPKKPTRSRWEAFGMSTLMIEQDTMRKENFFQESKTRDVVAESKNSRRGKGERKCQIELMTGFTGTVVLTPVKRGIAGKSPVQLEVFTKR